jgi:hypothetical protein
VAATVARLDPVTEIQEEFCQASLEPKLGQRHWAHVARTRNNMKMGTLTMFVSMS